MELRFPGIKRHEFEGDRGASESEDVMKNRSRAIHRLKVDYETALGKINRDPFWKLLRKQKISDIVDLIKSIMREQPAGLCMKAKLLEALISRPVTDKDVCYRLSCLSWQLIGLWWKLQREIEIADRELHLYS
ncbi:hypothetical protein RRG08_038841 [Elysia crispata]|uniref:Uncharacterized protein n=1 Tax=Elysia crispata TaxID=231223 RepID=A0AAE0YSS0_9GAST|nr:hypothetical protein RRG08_038841 [Elysia crispata]